MPDGLTRTDTGTDPLTEAMIRAEAEGVWQYIQDEDARQLSQENTAEAAE